MSGERESVGAVTGADWVLSAGSREKADAFLDEQKDLATEQKKLVRLQAEELRRELKLHHWSARFHHISSILKLAFELAVALIVLAIAALIGNAVWSAAHDHGVVIEAFQVPPNLANRGLSGQVVASQLLDKLTAMQNATQSARPAQSYANNWGNDIKVQIPDTGVSIGEFNRYLETWLGRETRIGGEVFRTANGITVTARVSGNNGASFSGPEASLDGLLQRAAENIYKQTQPYRYGSFIAFSGVHHATDATWEEARSVFTRLTLNSDPDERAWAWLGLANIARFHDGDSQQALRDFRTALSLVPDFATAFYDAGEVERVLGHSEAALADARAAQRILGSVGSDRLTDRARHYGLLNDAEIDIGVGDYDTVATGRREQADPLGQEVVWQNITLYDLSSAHDGNAARALLQSYAPHPHAVFETEFGHEEAVLLTDVVFGNMRAATAEEPSAEKEIFATHPRWDVKTFVRTALRPWLVLAKAESGDRAGAQAIIDTTPPDCYDCVRVRGKITALAHRSAAAAYWFAAAAKQGPSLPFAYADWGEMLLHNGNYDAAIAKFALANRKGPHFADPLEMWGEALMQKNRSDLALAKFAEANKYAPNWGRLHLEWGKALMWSGDKAGARKQFEIASRLDLSAADAANLHRMKV